MINITIDMEAPEFNRVIDSLGYESGPKIPFLKKWLKDSMREVTYRHESDVAAQLFEDEFIPPEFT